MKYLAIAFLIFLFACTGKQGPTGPQGAPGVVDTLPGVPCNYYQLDGILSAPLYNGIVPYWNITLLDPVYADSTMVQVWVKPDTSGFWHEPSWAFFDDYGGVKIFGDIGCKEGYAYRISVIYY